MPLQPGKSAWRTRERSNPLYCSAATVFDFAVRAEARLRALGREALLHTDIGLSRCGALWRELILRLQIRRNALESAVRGLIRRSYHRWKEKTVSAQINLGLILLDRLAPVLGPVLKAFQGRRVLYVGQCYYNSWYLSRELRKQGWKANVLDWDLNESNQLFYHGSDFRFKGIDLAAVRGHFIFYLRSIFSYDIFHFANAHGMHFGFPLHEYIARRGRPYDEVRMLKRLDKKIVYTNNGCLDGVSQTSFRSWAEPPVCDICRWRDVPTVCSDERNLVWGKVRNELADFQCNLGGNRLDFNDDSRVHEVPEFYCLDPDFWDPNMEIPPQRRLSQADGLVRLYQAVGNFLERTDAERVNIKSTHIYAPLVRELKRDGFNIELMFFSNVPNTEIRFYQMQADIVLDMLSYGWFGATAREAMMLAKPVVCYLRPAWLASIRQQIPEYVNELPIVNATPSNIRSVLIDLIRHPEKREEIGRRSREFAIKWHSSAAGARRLSRVYEALLAQ